jgi:hypothetical protein
VIEADLLCDLVGVDEVLALSAIPTSRPRWRPAASINW